MNPEMLEKVMNCRDLPTLPAVAMRVVELTNSEHVSMRELAETIQNDQALAAKVLKTVNSSLFGLRTRCASINQAIVMLGMGTVKTLALSFSLVGAISNAKATGFNINDHWRRALYTGIAARAIGARAGLPNPEEAFLGGLLQDVGMIAMVQALGQEYLSAIAQAEGDHRKVCRLELDALEIQHPDIGAMLARKWKLPESLVMPIKYHERATAAPIEHSDICRAIGLGNIAADLMTATEPAPHLRRFYQRASQWFNLTTSEADDVLKIITQQTREASSLLSVPIGQIARADKIIEQARARLGEIEVTSEPIQDATNDIGEREGVDDLTGVMNRFRFEQAIVTAFEQTRCGVGPIAVALYEIDNFDNIAASHGQDASDSALIWLASRLERGFAPVHGVVARYGDSSFVVLVTRQERAQVLKVCEAIRGEIAAEPVQLIAASLGSPRYLSLTCSVGVAAVDKGSIERFETATQLLGVVEQALVAARSAGTNMVRVYAPALAA